MTEATGKLAQWRLKLSEYELYIIHSVCEKQRAAVALTRLKTKHEDKKTLYDKVPVITVSEIFSARAPQSEVTNLEFIKKPKSAFVPFIPEASKIASITENGNTEVPTLAEFIRA